MRGRRLDDPLSRWDGKKVLIKMAEFEMRWKWQEQASHVIFGDSFKNREQCENVS